MNFHTLPNLVALTILVAVFRAILRQDTSERLHLWLTAWILVLVHFVAQFLQQGEGLWARVTGLVSLGALELASIAFLISVSPSANSRRRQLILAAALGVPALLYTAAILWDVTAHGFYYAVIGLAAVASIQLIRKWLEVTPFMLGLLLTCLVVAAALVWAVMRGHADFGINFLLAAFNFVVAWLYWRRFQRASAGVLTTVIGFVAWGAVFPAGILFYTFAPNIRVESEVWNIPKYFVAVGMILTLLEDQVQRSAYLAYHDELTGLPNRRLLQDRLEQALTRADRVNHKVAVLLIDLDRFKEVNDNFGHRIGDIALQETVARLLTRMRASDTLARSGGDEFTVVSDVTDAGGADVLVSALESALAQPIKVEDEWIQTGLSIGVALFPDDGRTPDELRAVADRAMYVAKRANRGSTV